MIVVIEIVCVIVVISIEIVVLNVRGDILVSIRIIADRIETKI